MMVVVTDGFTIDPIIGFWRMCQPFCGTSYSTGRQRFGFDSVLCSDFLVTDYHCENRKRYYQTVEQVETN